MVKKLRLVLRIPRLRLALKALLLAAAAQFLPAWIFVALAGLVYFTDAGLPLLSSYLLLSLSGLILTGHIPALLFLILFSAAFLLLLGVKEMVFIKRERAHFIFLVLGLVFYFWGFLSGLVGLWLVAVVAFFFLKDFLADLALRLPEKESIIALIFALVIAELAWLHLWLPLPAIASTINLAAISAAFAYLAERNLSGELSTRPTLLAITFCSAVLLLTPLFVFI
jgi:hypothetical protein